MGHGQRVICFEGDESFQLTAQELSTIIRHDLRVSMFLIENSGYEIEWWIHGMEAHYNKIPQWQYSKFPEAFSPKGSSHKVKTWKVRSRSELETLLNDRTLLMMKDYSLWKCTFLKETLPRPYKYLVKALRNELHKTALWLLSGCNNQ